MLQDLLVKDQRNKMEQGENGVGNSLDEDDVAVVRHEREKCYCDEKCAACELSDVFSAFARWAMDSTPFQA